MEYAGLNASKCREQSRWDDLIMWMNCMLGKIPLLEVRNMISFFFPEIYNPHFKQGALSLLQLPWTGEPIRGVLQQLKHSINFPGQDNVPAAMHMKSPDFPAHALLRYCPEEWFAIRMHLYLSDRRHTPDYVLIKELLETAYGKMKIQKKKRKKSKPTPVIKGD